MLTIIVLLAALLCATMALTISKQKSVFFPHSRDTTHQNKTYWTPREKPLWPSVSFGSVSEQARVLVENNSMRPFTYVWIMPVHRGIFEGITKPRMARFGRDFWRSVSPAPCSEEGQLENVSPGPCWNITLFL